MAPAAARAMAYMAFFSALIWSSPTSFSRYPAIRSVGISENSNFWQRESTVTGSLCGSVVIIINMMCSGGSSKVFKQRVKSIDREHVHFVYYIHAVFRRHRHVLYIFAQCAYVVDPGVGRSVYLYDVEIIFRGKRAACVAFGARFAVSGG